MPTGSTPISRKDVRQALASGLTTALTGAQAVYRYQKSDFDQQSPVVRILSSGSERPAMTAQGIRSKFSFTVELWVLYANGATWTEENAEDAMDTLEQQVISYVAANQVTSTWTTLRYGRPSTLGNVTVGGAPYLVEEIVLVAEVYG